MSNQYPTRKAGKTPNMSRQTAIEYARNNQEKVISDWMDFLRIPSVSTLPENEPDMVRAATWLTEKLKRMGFKAEMLPSGGPPVVYGEWQGAGKGAKTLLMYGHYDVQPVEPLEEWLTKPFEPSIVGSNLYARGASDMKGPVMEYFAALEAMLATNSLPINIKFLLEGEEEIGSPHLEEFLKKNNEKFSCDVVLNGDTMMVAPNTPTLIYALRGLAYYELRITTLSHDLHSGIFGGAVPNAGKILCDLIAGMHDSTGRVTLPGFYDDVLSLDQTERDELARIPYDEQEFLSQATARAAIGEAGYTSTERMGARPTLEVNGLLSGFTGEGSKTVLPARAMAKISMRLVPHQKPEKVKAQLTEYLKQNAPPYVEWEVLDLAGGTAAIVRRDLPEMQAAIRALEAVFGKRPVFYREGGSVPVVSLMQDILGKESILMGFGLPDDNLHAPNEKMNLTCFKQGIESYIQFAFELNNGQ
jgi:acetylornithine deacetylase/succinyl-diaminopimelate desuccinylase-like protein